MPNNYIVGIDLGTTNTVVAYVQKNDESQAIQLFEIEQLVALGEVAARPSLPSLCYHPARGELCDDDIQLPWRLSDSTCVPQAVIGTLARELGSQVPGRLVASAKSWLSHPSVDRTAAILPWGAPEDISKVSPIAASASFLTHVRAAWNHRFPNSALESQDVVLTVPASFDEAARELTVEAAKLAGIPQARLLEEPQAAFYHWSYRHRDQLDTELQDTHLVLVCDVGGGTTDLTLIRVESSGTRPKLTRVGVGDHLMLGGDNMDLGLAHLAERRLSRTGRKLSTAQMSQLIQQCRLAKERLLDPAAPEKVSVTVLGAGSKLIGGARSTELTRSEVGHMIVDGFFPPVSTDDQPQRARGGIVEFGLPYAADPAITRQVALFLARHAQVSREALGEGASVGEGLPVPDALLLNGGVFRSASLAGRLLDVMSGWRGQPVRLLHNDNPDAAVARGAVAYGLACLGTAPKIGGGSARSYFLLLDKDEQKQGVCVLPRGSEEGKELQLANRTFALRLGQPVRFHSVSTTADTIYSAGDIVALDCEDFISLPPIATIIRPGADLKVKEVPVQLATTLTEVGTLEMYCVSVEDTSQRWKLEFQLRGEAAEVEAMGVTTELHPRFNEAADWIDRIYGSRSQKVSPTDVKQLRNNLENILGRRDDWDTPLLRELFGALLERLKHRRRSANHERLWFNLAGYCLRPGFGYPLDDWRIEQLWTLFDQGIQFAQENQVWSEWWTLWRRVAGGLDESAQTRILDGIGFYLQPPGKAARPSGRKKQGQDDMVRLAASLEHVAVDRKIEIGEWLLERLHKPKENPQTWWAVGRIGARKPFYGSAHNIIPAVTAEQWLDSMLALNWKRIEQAAFAATLIACMTGDRERDVEDELREKVIDKLQTIKAPQAWIAMVREVTQLDAADERRVFGDSLPSGLKLVH